MTFEYTEDQKISGINGSAINGADPITYQAGEYIDITDENVINVTGLQPSGDYALNSDLSGKLDTSAYHEYSAGQYLSLNDYVFSVTGLQPEGDYATKDYVNSATSGKLDSSAYTAPVNADWNSTSGLSEILNKPSTEEVQFEELDLSSYATHDEVTSATSGKLDASAYHEYSAGQYLSLNDYVFSVTGLQPELNFDYTDAGKISAINGSAVYGSEGGAIYEAGQYININDQNVISVTGLQPSGNYVTPADLSGKLDTSAYEAPVQSDWTEDDNTLQSYILHKPVEIGLIAGSGVWFEDMTSAVKINCSATGLDYAVSGISGVSGIFIEDAGDHMNIGYSGSVGSGGGTSGYYTDLGGTTYFEDDFTFTHDGHFSMGVMEKAMVPVSNLVTDEGKVPVIYVRDGRSYYLLERIIPAYTSATNGKILGVQNNTLAWINNPVKIVADSGDIPASGSSDNILYVVAAD